MTTTPNEPVKDPDVVPSGDPSPNNPDPTQPPTPGEDPGSVPDPEPEPV